MTIENYQRATAILKEKDRLEERLAQLRMSIDFTLHSNEYAEICNKLFSLGQEFSAL
jgi:hypothetical protein